MLNDDFDSILNTNDESSWEVDKLLLFVSNKESNLNDLYAYMFSAVRSYHDRKKKTRT